MPTISYTGLTSEEEIREVESLLEMKASSEEDEALSGAVMKDLLPYTMSIMKAFIKQYFRESDDFKKEDINSNAYVVWIENFKSFRGTDLSMYEGFIRITVLRGGEKASGYTTVQLRRFKDACKVREEIEQETCAACDIKAFSEAFSAIHPWISLTGLSEQEYYRVYFEGSALCIGLGEWSECDLRHSHLDETVDKVNLEQAKTVLEGITKGTVDRLAPEGATYKMKKSRLNYEIAGVFVPYMLIENHWGSNRLGCGTTGHKIACGYDERDGIYKGDEIGPELVKPLMEVLSRHDRALVEQLYGKYDLYNLERKGDKEAAKILNELKGCNSIRIVRKKVEDHVRPFYRKYLHIKIDMQSNIELCDCEEFLALPPSERVLFLKIFEQEKKDMQKRMKEIGRM